MIKNAELIKMAEEYLNPVLVDDNHWAADVASALVTDKGNVYRGVCLDVGSGVGFCAERSAISQMVASKEYTVKKIVAVWNNNPAKDLYVLPPCGACREFMKQICKEGLNTEVILGKDEVVLLKDLLPRYEWPEKKVE